MTTNHIERLSNALIRPGRCVLREVVCSGGGGEQFPTNKWLPRTTIYCSHLIDRPVSVATAWTTL
jgi:hypothetical protein